MSKLLSYLRSLCNATVAKAVHDYTPVWNGQVSHSVTVEQWTDVIAPFDGFLVLHGGTNVTGVYIANYQRGGAIAHMNTNPANWQSCNAIVAKGETYELGVGWSAEAKGDSCGIFVPFNFCAT